LKAERSLGDEHSWNRYYAEMQLRKN